MPPSYPITGSCACHTLTYSVLRHPIWIQACHCTHCQRETGSASAVNAFIETANVKITSEAQPLWSEVPTASGKGQLTARCPKCYTTIVSQYGGSSNAGKRWAIRVGTLDKVKHGCNGDEDGRGDVEKIPEGWEVQAHLWTKQKMDWVKLPRDGEGGVRVFKENYDPKTVWDQKSLERYMNMM